MIAEPQFMYTRHQTPRGARADAEKGKKIYLFKNVSLLHATYQIRLLAYRAYKENKQLVIQVSKRGQRADSLKEFMKANPGLVVFERC